MSDTHSSNVPVDRLTRICDTLIAAVDAHPESHENDRMIVFLTSETHRECGTALHGYTELGDAVADMFVHVEAALKVMGKKMVIVPIGPVGRDE